MHIDNIDWTKTVLSDTSRIFISNPTPALNETIKIRVWVYRYNDIKDILFASTIETYGIQAPMKRQIKNDFFEEFSIEYKVLTKKVLYYFIIKTHNDGIYFFDTLGIQRNVSSYKNQFKIVANLKLATWVTESVFYQIFPDRFKSSGKNLYKDNFEYGGFKKIIKGWEADPLPWELARTFDHNGGDLEGIQEEIPYLEDLGINAIYLNPIFKSPPNHKYHTEDFFEIDPGFGTKEDLVNLINSLHRKNIRIVLDGVFNHVGYYHKWFNKFYKYKDDPGAYNSKDSKYYEFFIFNEHPDKYLCWANVPDLPTLNYLSEKLRDVIYRKKDSVMQYWLNPPFNIDGWRLDVLFNIGNYPTKNVKIGEQIVREMREVIKQYEDKYFLGECFHDLASYLQGDKIDAAMNYQGFLNPVWSFLGDERFYILEGGWQTGIKQVKNRAEVLQKELADLRTSITTPLLHQMYNLIGSHDTPRVLTVLKDIELVKVAVGMQFTYPGVPAIYYGDEIGMEGENDPYNRRPFRWKKETWNTDLRDFYKKIIKIRKESDILKTGAYKDLYANGDIFSFARFDDEDAIVTILNIGEATTVSIPIWLIGKISGTVDLLLSNKAIDNYFLDSGNLHIKLPTKSVAIFKLY